MIPARKNEKLEISLTEDLAIVCCVEGLLERYVGLGTTSGCGCTAVDLDVTNKLIAPSCSHYL